MKFEVSKSFFDKLEDSVFGVVVVKNFDNEVSYDYINKVLRKICNLLKKNF